MYTPAILGPPSSDGILFCFFTTVEVLSKYFSRFCKKRQKTWYVAESCGQQLVTNFAFLTADPVMFAVQYPRKAKYTFCLLQCETVRIISSSSSSFKLIVFPLKNTKQEQRCSTESQ